jgi:hypothetical protein
MEYWSVGVVDCRFRPAPKGHKDSAQGFNPGLGVSQRRALKVAPTPRMRGAIPNRLSTPTLQYSITPRGRIRGRGRERSASRVAPEFGAVTPKIADRRFGRPRLIFGCPFRAHRQKTHDPGLKPWAESCCSFGAEERVLELDLGSASMAICFDIHRFHTPSFFTYASIRFIASWSFTKLVAKQQRANPSPDSPKALPGTTATRISFNRPRQNSRLVRLVGRISGNT